MTNIKVSKDKHIDSSMLDETASKMCIKTKKVINNTKRSKTLSKVKPVKNISKKQSFLEINSVQKEVLPSHKLQDHPYE